MGTSNETNFDLVVVGGGAGGLSAARTARRSGARVLLVSAGPLGGDCTFTGCVPSKTLIASSRQGLGFRAAFERVQATVDHIAATENAGVLELEGISVRDGFAKLVSPTELDVDGDRVTARRVIVATGAAAAIPPIAGLHHVPYLTNDTLFDLREPIESIIILGGGAIGCELGQALAGLGVATTLVERADRVLEREEPEASEIVADALRGSGVDLRLGATATDVMSTDRDGITLTADDGSMVHGDRLLVASGRTPNSGGMGLEAIGIELDGRGNIVTDEHLQTTVEGVYAVGDVTGLLPFTHAADEMGRVAATNAVGGRRPRPMTYRSDSTPWVTFTDPEVARVGMTEAEAANHGGRVAHLPMAEVDRAITEGRTEGFVKLIAGPRRLLRSAGGGRILGATIVGPCGGELIAEPALLMRTGGFAGRLAQSTHAYPTWSMGLQKAAAQFFFEIEGREAYRARR